MSPFKRPFLADEELGKKDDDHRPRISPDQQWHPTQWKPLRRRRLLLLPVILYLIYIFFKNIPTDLGPLSQRRKSSVRPSQHAMPNAPPLSEAFPSDLPPRNQINSENKDALYYQGQLQFYELGKTLKLFQIPAGQAGKVASSATIFAAASLGSVSDMLPLACRMANQQSGKVHFLLTGRDDVSVEGIQRVNGLTKINCPVYWHDARVDYAPWSTDDRMEQAVAAVLPYVQEYLRPQVIITHGESLEDQFFSRGIRRTRDLGMAHIVLPHAARELMWMASLDSNALRTWNDIHVEILIHASPDSTGSLTRLVRSLENADFLGHNPSLTIELPSRVDSELLRFLKDTPWSPDASNNIKLRRRIQLHETNAYEASIHAVEAFYPRNPDLSHVLLLSPDIELSPVFYHYLIYATLKYRYSTRASVLLSKMMGISLELPSYHLTTEHFKQPDIEKTQFFNRNGPDMLPLYLMQAPNSNAALYFGDKWAELHSFLARRLTIADADGGGLLQNKKVISKRYPAFMESLFELLCARGYYLLYPAFSDKGRFALATVHDDLVQTPEEFSKDVLKPPSSDYMQGFTEKSLLADSTLMSLLNSYSLDLPDVSSLPILSHHGEERPESDFGRETEDYLNKFRLRHGGCSENSLDEMSAEMLFCAE